MRQYRIKRQIADVALAENTPVTFDLPRGYDIECIGIRLYGGLQVTVAATTVRAESPLGVIQRVELIADGKNTIASWPFVLLSQGNLQRHNLGARTPPSAVGIATYQVEGFGFLDQAMIDGVRPKDSNLRTSGMSLLQLRLTVGPASAGFTGGTENFSNLRVSIFSYETVEIADQNGDVTTPAYLLKRSYQDIALPTTNANQEVSLPVGNSMRGVILRSEGAVTAGEPSDAVINNVILRSGVDVRLNLSWNNLKAANKSDYEPQTFPTGFAFADLMCIGASSGVKAADAWDLTRASEAKLVLDVTGGANNKVTVGTIEMIA